MKTVQLLKKQLPHGALKEIAIKTNYSKSSISLFFQGKISLTKSTDILQVAIEILRENKEKEQKVTEELNKVLGL
jgi:hypothetical protein